MSGLESSGKYDSNELYLLQYDKLLHVIYERCSVAHRIKLLIKEPYFYYSKTEMGQLYFLSFQENPWNIFARPDFYSILREVGIV